MNDLHATLYKPLHANFEVAGELLAPLDGYRVTALLGPSGSGKTTWLRLLAGLDRPQTGRIRFREEIWFDSQQGICLSPQQREIGFVFQEPTLFPHLNAEQNIAFGLAHLSRRDRRKRVEEMLALVQLQNHRYHYPSQLSGGQRQRLALAQVLARRPRLLLLDEPFSALDVPLRRQLWRQWRQWLEPLAIPVLLVSHDREEVVTLAHQVAIVLNGRIWQMGSVAQVFNHPKDERVAQLVGMETIVPGRIARITEDLAEVQVGSVQLLAVLPADWPGPADSGAEVFVGIRAEDVLLVRDHWDAQQVSARNVLPARVVQLEWMGHTYTVRLDAGFPLAATITRAAVESLGLAPGQPVMAVVKASALHLFCRS
jgi:molybdate transport system ATP-binding protein